MRGNNLFKCLYLFPFSFPVLQSYTISANSCYLFLCFFPWLLHLPTPDPKNCVGNYKVRVWCLELGLLPSSLLSLQIKSRATGNFLFYGLCYPIFLIKTRKETWGQQEKMLGSHSLKGTVSLLKLTQSTLCCYWLQVFILGLFSEPILSTTLTHPPQTFPNILNAC